MGRDGAELCLFLMKFVPSIWLKIGIIHSLTSKEKVKNKGKSISVKKLLK